MNTNFEFSKKRKFPWKCMYNKAIVLCNHNLISLTSYCIHMLNIANREIMPKFLTTYKMRALINLARMWKRMRNAGILYATLTFANIWWFALACLCNSVYVQFKYYKHYTRTASSPRVFIWFSLSCTRTHRPFPRPNASCQFATKSSFYPNPSITYTYNVTTNCLQETTTILLSSIYSVLFVP